MEDEEEVLHVKKDLLYSIKSKEKSMESLLKAMSKKIIGFKYSMEDHQADAKESSKHVQAVAEELKQIDVQITIRKLCFFQC